MDTKQFLKQFVVVVDVAAGVVVSKLTKSTRSRLVNVPFWVHCLMFVMTIHDL